MTEARYKYLLWLAGSFMLLANSVFSEPGISAHYGFSVNLYYLNVTFSIFLFHLFIFLNFKKYFVTFLLLGLSLNAFLDELLFQPTKLQLNELVFAIAFLSFGLYRQRLISRYDKTSADGGFCDSKRSAEGNSNE